MDPQQPDKLVLVAADIACSLKLISEELSAIAGNLTRLEASLAAATAYSAPSPGPARNLDLEVRYPPPPQPAPQSDGALAHNVMATAPERRGKHGKFCCCITCTTARARQVKPADGTKAPPDLHFRDGAIRGLPAEGEGEDELERARRRR